MSSSMQSGRQIIEAVLQYSFSFTAAKKIKPNISTTYQQIHPSQILSQSFSTWLDLVKCHCSQILKYYPADNYKKYYNQQVFLIDAELKFQDSISTPLRYTYFLDHLRLIKSKKQVDHFRKKYAKKMHKENPEAPVHPNIFQVLTNFSLKNPNDKHQFQDFIEQVAPHDKWNIRVLGQYRVSDIEEGSFRNCMNQTVFRPCQRFNQYYLTIANECILYSDEDLTNGVVEEVIPYTSALKIEYIETFGNRFVAKIVSGRTQITAAFEDLHDLIKFAYTINLVKKSLPHYFKLDPDIKSFSPVRENNWTKFYCDGKSYFSDLHDAIEKAEKKICMTGWCITPYFLLKRPESIETGQSRLDRTLTRAAKRGVKIFILVFQEPSLLLSNDSFNVWSMFENMSENFKVLRHPGILIPQLWSHHEKSVIIDEKVGFMGGLDICYGRWDTYEHPVYDKDHLWDGADYNNERLRAITEPRKYGQSNLNRDNQPRMPWQDIALQVKGPSVVDMQRHFCQYWYFAINDLTDDIRDQLINFKARYDELKRQRNQQKQQEKQEQLFNKKTLSQQQMTALQILYANSMQKDKDYDYSFADRIRHAKQAFKDLIQNQQARSSKQIIVEGFSVNQKAGNMKLRLCRSSSTWSTGIQTTQHSIYDAYLKLIKGAEKFIYIENQFFMSYDNLISETIAQRIIQAHQARKEFKVIVMMPLLPGFEGDPRDQKAGVLRGQMQFQFEAINRHESSIFQILEKSGMNIKIEDYIYFFGLRNHGLFGPQKKNPKTEIIYVHSKLMIVDDRHMIIGSANINDRSLLGNRDSELAMVIEDPNGSYGKGEIFDFRCQIFGKHFGLDQGERRGKCSDLDGYWDRLINNAKNNTEIYRNVFGCYPDNEARRFGDIAELEKKANRSLYNEKITKLKGHYVEWPVHFLQHEDLSIRVGQKEFLLPKSFLT